MGTRPANICLECGLCCDGTMFSRLPPVFDDPASGRIRPDGNGPELLHPPGPAQPCPAHRYACSIYRERPGACHHYDCALRRRLHAGEVDHATATSLIARARTLRDRTRDAIEAAIGRHAGTGLNDLAVRFIDLSRRQGGGDRHTEARVALAALDGMLHGHFHVEGHDAPGVAPA